MEKLFVAAASLIVAFVAPVGAQTPGPNLVVAVSPDRDTGNAGKTVSDVRGTRMVAMPQRQVPADSGKARTTDTLPNPLTENPANNLNWMQGGGG
jgi:hypothetical protein